MTDDRRFELIPSTVEPSDYYAGVEVIRSENGLIEEFRTFFREEIKPDEESADDADAPLHLQELPNLLADCQWFVREFRQGVTTLIAYSQVLPSIALDRRLEKFARHCLHEISIDNSQRFFFSLNAWEKIRSDLNRHSALVRTVDRLDSILFVNAITEFDRLFTELFQSTFSAKSHFFSGLQSELKASDVFLADSISDLKARILQNQINEFTRGGLAEKVDLFESRFKIRLKDHCKNFDRVSFFIEIRNCFVHNKGHPSQKLLKMRAKKGAAPFDEGKGIVVSRALMSECVEELCSFYLSAVGAVYYTLYSKKETVSIVHGWFLHYCLELVKMGVTLPPRKVLTHLSESEVPRNERTDRMIRINLATIIRMKDGKDAAIQFLDQQDWSSVGWDFEICLAALREDFRLVVQKMRELRSVDYGITRSNYLNWPVFYKLREDSEFQSAFSEIFE